VHHDALKKVNFLLRVDELSGCELPTVPECVIAAKRAELQRRHLAHIKDTALELMEDEGGVVGGPLGHMASSPSAPLRHCGLDEEDEDDGFSPSAYASTDKLNVGTCSTADPPSRLSPLKGAISEPAAQPNMEEEGVDELDEGGAAAWTSQMRT
jgi:hypothetical protein